MNRRWSPLIGSAIVLLGGLSFVQISAAQAPRDTDHALAGQIETTIEAPDVLARPYTFPPQLWARIPFSPPVIQDALGFCADFDRSVDSVNGRQTFDLTPPPDVPPPPQ